MDEREEEKNFLSSLQKFWEQRGQVMKIPQIGGRELEVYKLYKAVTKRGGLKVVSSNKLWKEIVDQFQFPATCTSASFTLRNHYQKLLLSYEQKYFFGKDDGMMYEEEVGSNRKKAKWNPEDENQPGTSYVVDVEDRAHQQEFNGQPLQTLLTNQYAKQDKQEQIYFIKKSKIQAQPSEVKRIMLAFESKIDDELTFAINSLLLFSCNYNVLNVILKSSFLIEQYPQLLETITNYIEETVTLISHLNRAYQFQTNLQIIQFSQLESFQGFQQRRSLPIQTDLIKDLNVIDHYNTPLATLISEAEQKKIPTPSEILHNKKYIDLIQGTYDKKSEAKHLEKLKTLLVALRNLVMIKSNEMSFYKHDRIMSVFYQLLISGSDLEIQKLCLEIFSILSKHIQLKMCNFKDPFLTKLFEILNGDAQEEIALVVDILRNLIHIQDNENILEGCLSEYIDQFARLLAYQNQEIREAILEIFCYLTDLKMATRLQIAKHPKILQRITAILTSGQCKASQQKSMNDKINERHVKCAAITLGNISQAPASKQYLQYYEKEIMIVAASDETATPFLSPILYEFGLD
ncbi:hypothetical protein pb186bvf_004561 [Paramecium bursaria]